MISYIFLISSILYALLFSSMGYSLAPWRGPTDFKDVRHTLDFDGMLKEPSYSLSQAATVVRDRGLLHGGIFTGFLNSHTVHGGNVQELLDKETAQRSPVDFHNYVSGQTRGVASAVVELASNAVDANRDVNALSPIGKFGMGAMQILDVIGEKKGEGVYYSTVNQGNLQELVLTKERKKGDAELCYRIRSRKAKPQEYGTRVELKKSLSEAEQKEITDTLRKKFAFQESVAVVLNGALLNDFKGWSALGKKRDFVPQQVQIMVNAQGVSVMDLGWGMSAETIFKVFLQPRVSSKRSAIDQAKREYAPNIFYTKDFRKKIEKKTSISLVVQSNAVETWDVNGVDEGLCQLPSDMAIVLPPDTWQPETRDKLELSEDGFVAMFRMMEDIVQDKKMSPEDKLDLLNGLAYVVRTFYQRQRLPLALAEEQARAIVSRFLGQLRTQRPLLPSLHSLKNSLSNPDTYYFVDSLFLASLENLPEDSWQDVKGLGNNGWSVVAAPLDERKAFYVADEKSKLLYMSKAFLDRMLPTSYGVLKELIDGDTSKPSRLIPLSVYCQEEALGRRAQDADFAGWIKPYLQDIKIELTVEEEKKCKQHPLWKVEQMKKQGFAAWAEDLKLLELAKLGKSAESLEQDFKATLKAMSNERLLRTSSMLQVSYPDTSTRPILELPSFYVTYEHDHCWVHDAQGHRLLSTSFVTHGNNDTWPKFRWSGDPTTGKHVLTVVDAESIYMFDLSDMNLIQTQTVFPVQMVPYKNVPAIVQIFNDPLYSVTIQKSVYQVDHTPVLAIFVTKGIRSIGGSDEEIYMLDMQGQLKEHVVCEMKESGAKKQWIKFRKLNKTVDIQVNGEHVIGISMDGAGQIFASTSSEYQGHAKLLVTHKILCAGGRLSSESLPSNGSNPEFLVIGKNNFFIEQYKPERDLWSRSSASPFTVAALANPEKKKKTREMEVKAGPEVVATLNGYWDFSSNSGAVGDVWPEHVPCFQLESKEGSVKAGKFIWDIKKTPKDLSISGVHVAPENTHVLISKDYVALVNTHDEGMSTFFDKAVIYSVKSGEKVQEIENPNIHNVVTMLEDFQTLHVRLGDHVKNRLHWGGNQKVTEDKDAGFSMQQRYAPQALGQGDVARVDAFLKQYADVLSFDLGVRDRFLGNLRKQLLNLPFLLQDDLEKKLLFLGMMPADFCEQIMRANSEHVSMLFELVKDSLDNNVLLKNMKYVQDACSYFDSVVVKGIDQDLLGLARFLTEMLDIATTAPYMLKLKSFAILKEPSFQYGGKTPLQRMIEENVVEKKLDDVPSDLRSFTTLFLKQDERKDKKMEASSHAMYDLAELIAATFDTAFLESLRKEKDPAKVKAAVEAFRLQHPDLGHMQEFLEQIIVGQAGEDDGVCLRELIQNAQDAISISKTANKKVECDIAIKPYDGREALVITVRDYVGIDSLYGLIHHLLTPDVSSKRESAGEAGSAILGMFGKGFFSVFNGADKVRVRTGKNGQIYQCNLRVDKFMENGRERFAIVVESMDVQEDMSFGSGTVIERVVYSDNSQELRRKEFAAIEALHTYADGFHYANVVVNYKGKAINTPGVLLGQSSTTFKSPGKPEGAVTLTQVSHRDFSGASKITLGGAFLDSLDGQLGTLFLQQLPREWVAFLEHHGPFIIDLPLAVPLVSTRTAIKNEFLPPVQQAIKDVVVQAILHVYVKEGVRVRGVPGLDALPLSGAGSREVQALVQIPFRSLIKDGERISLKDLSVILQDDYSEQRRPWELSLSVAAKEDLYKRAPEVMFRAEEKADDFAKWAPTNPALQPACDGIKSVMQTKYPHVNLVFRESWRKNRVFSHERGRWTVTIPIHKAKDPKGTYGFETIDEYHLPWLDMEKAALALQSGAASPLDEQILKYRLAALVHEVEIYVDGGGVAKGADKPVIVSAIGEGVPRVYRDMERKAFPKTLSLSEKDKAFKTKVDAYRQEWGQLLARAHKPTAQDPWVVPYNILAKGSDDERARILAIILAMVDQKIPFEFGALRAFDRVDASIRQFVQENYDIDLVTMPHQHWPALPRSVWDVMAVSLDVASKKSSPAELLKLSRSA